MNKVDLINRINRSKYISARCYAKYWERGSACILITPKNEGYPFFNEGYYPESDKRYSDYYRVIFLKWLDNIGWEAIDTHDYLAYILAPKKSDFI